MTSGLLKGDVLQMFEDMVLSAVMLRIQVGGAVMFLTVLWTYENLRDLPILVAQSQAAPSIIL